jgi:hypothetical protein
VWRRPARARLAEPRRRRLRLLGVGRLLAVGLRWRRLLAVERLLTAGLWRRRLAVRRRLLPIGWLWQRLLLLWRRRRLSRVPVPLPTSEARNRRATRLHERATAALGEQKHRGEEGAAAHLQRKAPPTQPSLHDEGCVEDRKRWAAAGPRGKPLRETTSEAATHPPASAALARLSSALNKGAV